MRFCGGIYNVPAVFYHLLKNFSFGESKIADIMFRCENIEFYIEICKLFLNDIPSICISKKMLDQISDKFFKILALDASKSLFMLDLKNKSKIYVRKILEL